MTFSQRLRLCFKKHSAGLIWTAVVLSYPINYVFMDKGLGFYDKNPVVTIAAGIQSDDGEWSKSEIMLTRFALLLASPAVVPINATYMVIDSATNIDDQTEEGDKRRAKEAKEAKATNSKPEIREDVLNAILQKRNWNRIMDEQT